MKNRVQSLFTLLSALVVVLSPAGVAIAQDAPITHQITLPSGQTWCDDSMINSLFDTINAFRTANGAPALAMNTLGMQDAELRASQFATYMQTANPQAPGFNPHTGYDTTAESLGYNLVSEDLAYITTDPSYIVYTVWQDPLHLAAMLATQANVMGVSCVNNGFPYWTYEPGACTGSGCGTVTPPPPPPPPPPPTGTPTLTSDEWTFVSLINAYRAQSGLGPLEVDVELENAAQWMSNDMATKGYLSHTDSLGRSSGQRLAAFGYTYSWGEDLASGFSDAQSVLTGFETACDPDASGNCTYEHRMILLGAGYTALGIANVNGYWSADFGTVVEQGITGPGTNPSAPTIASFTANPTTVTAGQPTTLSWSVTGATSVTMDNGIGALAASGSGSISPAQTTTYTLTATNTAGSATARVTVTVTASAPSVPTIVSFTANPTTVTAGQPTTLSWSVTGATSVTMDNGIGALPASGSGPISPAQTTTYTLTAANTAGSATARVTVTVTAPAPGVPTIASFTANPSTVTAGQSTTLSWNVTGATSVTMDNGVGALASSGSRTIAPAQTTTYTLTAANSAGSSTARAMVTVTAAPSAQPPTAPVLTSATAANSSEVDLAWTAATSSATIAGYEIVRSGMARATVSGATLTYADRSVSPNATYTYSIWAFDSAGHMSPASNSMQITVPGSSPSVPTIASFAASPSTMTAGQSVTLSWSVAGASSVTIDNGVGAVSAVASRTISPSQTTTYTLTATNSAGSATARATVTVAAAPSNQPTTAPVLTSATPASSSEVDLAWTAATSAASISGYEILRNGMARATVSGATLTYADRAVSPNATYTYSIWAFDAAGHMSPVSNSIQVTVPGSTTSAPMIVSFTASPSTVTAGQSVTLSWSVAGAGSVAIDNGIGDVSSGTSRTISPSQTTTYTLTATNSAGSATARAMVTVTAAPSNRPPTAPVLTSATAASSTEVDLAWTASTSSASIAGYEIVRNGMSRATVSGATLTYADRAVSPNTTYTYSIWAFDAAGHMSPVSNTIQVAVPGH